MAQCLSFFDRFRHTATCPGTVAEVMTNAVLGEENVEWANQSIRVLGPQWIGHIALSFETGTDAQGIPGDVGSATWIVIPEPVVVEACLRVLVLAGPAERAGAAGAGDVAQIAVGVDGRGPDLGASGVVHGGGRTEVVDDDRVAGVADELG